MEIDRIDWHWDSVTDDISDDEHKKEKQFFFKKLTGFLKK